jgi:hypothetical protein
VGLQAVLPTRNPEAALTPAERELADRQAEANKGPNWDAVPPVEVLERVLEALRMPDIGQASLTTKRTVIGVKVEVTADEIAAAGGDRLAALGDKIARQAQDEVLRAQNFEWPDDQPEDDPRRP